MRAVATALLALVAATVATTNAAPPATTQAAGPRPRMTSWPIHWTPRDIAEKDTVAAFATDVTGDEGALLRVFPVRDFGDGLMTDDWADAAIAAYPKNRKDSKFSPPKRAFIGGRPVTVLEVDRLVKNKKWHDELIYFRQGDFFCIVHLFSVPSRWLTVERLADDLVKSVR